MLFAVFFAFWRFMEIITLVGPSMPWSGDRPLPSIVFARLTLASFPQIPTMGMLAYFVDIYVKSNLLAPTCTHCP